MTLSGIRQKINVKYFMVAYLGLLLVFSSLYVHASTHLLAGASVVVLYSFFDLVWTRIRDRVWYLPISSWISGLVLSVVALAGSSALQAVALPLLAVLSKQLLHFGKSRHVFNPAAFGMAILNLFLPSISWWAVSGGVLPVIAGTVGLFILWRQRRWHIAFSFLGSLALSSVFFSVLRGGKVLTALAALQPFLLSGPVFFFATVMLIEPLTSGFSTRRQRMIFGCAVGFFTAAIAAGSRFIPQVNLDPLVAGLLLGNFCVCLFFLPSRSTIPVPPPAFLHQP